VLIWNRWRDADEAEPPSSERVAFVTGGDFARSGAPQREAAARFSYYFRLAEKPPFAARSFYAHLPVCPTQGESFGACYDRDNNEIPNSGITIIAEPSRLRVAFPWDICRYQQGCDWQHRPYFSPVANKHFVEVGPALDSAAFRQLLMEVLLYCFNWLGLPLVRVSPFYHDKKFFSFRIDADGFTESSTQAGLRIADKAGLPFTWFIDTGAWKKARRWLSRLREHGQDVQLHCFRHMTYASREVNDINIRKGLQELSRSGITPNSIVSPLGYNYEGFAQAIKDHGFVYSSEFGYAVDDLPSFPWNNDKYPLQIPVHPASSGVLRKAGFSSEEQFAHLFAVVERRCAADGICILYDHPNGGLDTRELQYADLFDRLRNRCYEYICMPDYCRIWLGRPKNPTILFDRGRIEVDGFRDNGFRLEQVTNGHIGPVWWHNAVLPQISEFQRSGRYCYPNGRTRCLARERNRSMSKERHYSRSQWYVNEVKGALARWTGYYRCRRFLDRVGWLRLVSKPTKPEG
jgi:hypothetical protein